MYTQLRCPTLHPNTTHKILYCVLICAALYLGLIFYFIFKVTYTEHLLKVGSASNTPKNWSVVSHQHVTSQTFELSNWQNTPYKEVQIPINKMVTLSGWLSIVNSKAPIVIVVHGIAPNSKENDESILISSFLAKNGINTLNIDLRNYGHSTETGNFIHLGQTEYRDIIGAFNWLQTEYHFLPEQIGVAGLSLGAVTTAIAFKHDKRIQAIWLDSPFTDFNNMFAYELSRHGFRYSKFLEMSVDQIAKTFIGFQPGNHTVLNALKNADGRAIYLTHGIEDNRIPVYHARKLIDDAKNRNVSLRYWLVDKVDHLDAMFRYPYLYQRNITKFFKKNLRHL